MKAKFHGCDLSTVNYIAHSPHISDATLPPDAFLIPDFAYSYAVRRTICQLSKTENRVGTRRTCPGLCSWSVVPG